MSSLALLLRELTDVLQYSLADTDETTARMREVTVGVVFKILTPLGTDRPRSRTALVSLVKMIQMVLSRFPGAFEGLHSFQALQLVSRLLPLLLIESLADIHGGLAEVNTLLLLAAARAKPLAPRALLLGLVRLLLDLDEAAMILGNEAEAELTVAVEAWEELVRIVRPLPPPPPPPPPPSTSAAKDTSSSLITLHVLATDPLGHLADHLWTMLSVVIQHHGWEVGAVPISLWAALLRSSTLTPRAHQGAIWGAVARLVRAQTLYGSVLADEIVDWLVRSCSMWTEDLRRNIDDYDLLPVPLLVHMVDILQGLPEVTEHLANAPGHAVSLSRVLWKVLLDGTDEQVDVCLPAVDLLVTSSLAVRNSYRHCLVEMAERGREARLVRVLARASGRARRFLREGEVGTLPHTGVEERELRGTDEPHHVRPAKRFRSTPNRPVSTEPPHHHPGEQAGVGVTQPELHVPPSPFLRHALTILQRATTTKSCSVPPASSWVFSLAADAIVLASLLAPRHFHVLLGYGESLVAQMRPNLSSRNVDEQILDLAALVADGAPLAGYRLAANFPKLAYHIMSRWLDRDEHADVEGQLRALIRAAISVDSQTRPVRDIWRHVFSMIYGSERSGKTRASAKMKTKTKAKTIRRGDGPGGLSRIRASLLACAFSACVTAIRATDDVSAISALDKSAEDAGEQELVALVSAYTDYMEGAHEHATEGGTWAILGGIQALATTIYGDGERHRAWTPAPRGAVSAQAIYRARRLALVREVGVGVGHPRGSFVYGTSHFWPLPRPNLEADVLLEAISRFLIPYVVSERTARSQTSPSLCHVAALQVVAVVLRGSVQTDVKHLPVLVPALSFVVAACRSRVGVVQRTASSILGYDAHPVHVALLGNDQALRERVLALPHRDMMMEADVNWAWYGLLQTLRTLLVRNSSSSTTSADQEGTMSGTDFAPHLGVLRGIATATARCPRGGNALILGLVTLIGELDPPGLSAQFNTAVYCHTGTLLLHLGSLGRGVWIGEGPARTGVMMSRMVDLDSRSCLSLPTLLQAAPLALEFVARNLATRPALFHELSDVVHLAQLWSHDPTVRSGAHSSDNSKHAFAQSMLPHVLSRLCMLGEPQRENLSLLGTYLGYMGHPRGMKPEQALVRDQLHLALVQVFRAQKEGLEALMTFLKDVCMEGVTKSDAFDILLNQSAPKLFWEVLWLGAGDAIMDDFERCTSFTLRAEDLVEYESKLGMVANLSQTDPTTSKQSKSRKRSSGKKSKAVTHNPDAPPVSVKDYLTNNGRVMQMLHHASDFCDGRVPPGLSQSPNQRCTTRDTVYAVRVLSLLGTFLQESIVDVVPQFTVLFSRGLESPEATVQRASLAGLAHFVRNLSAFAPKELSRIANSIVVMLLPYLDETSANWSSLDLAVRVLDVMLVDHTSAVGPAALRGLPPLPKLTQLKRVDKVLSVARGKLSLSEEISMFVAGLSHEAQSVRVATLTEVLRRLRDEKSVFKAALLRAAHDPQRSHDVRGLMTALLKCSSVSMRGSQAEKIQLYCAQCLGLLGAQDPARIPLDLTSPPELITEPMGFMKALTERHLVRMLRAASGLNVLLNTMLAIQMLLAKGADPDTVVGETIGTQPVRRENAVTSLFDSLDPSIQPMVKPLLSSKFTPIESGFPVQQRVLFSHKTTFKHWLYLWIRQLAEFTDGTWESILSSLRGVLMKDVQLMLFVLPHVVLLALSSGREEATNRVREEIIAVLEADHATMEGDTLLALQTVFGLLDVLNRYSWWCLLLKGREMDRTGSSMTSVSLSSQSGMTDSYVRNLLDAIPQRLRAIASHNVQASARALLYIDTQLRAHGNNNGAGLNPASNIEVDFDAQDISLLQKIYAQLEEPDGLSGVSKIRKQGVDLEAQIQIAEKRGSYAEALVLYEQEIRGLEQSGEGPTVTDYWKLKKGQLRSMLRIGMSRHVLSEINALPVSNVQVTGKATQESIAMGVAAAWRLSKWESVSELLGTMEDAQFSNNLGNDDQWEVRLGEILNAVHQGNVQHAATALAAARREVMAPLSAAIMESDVRAYPHMVRLHILQEIEDATRFILPDARLGGLMGKTGPKERERMLSWATRIASIAPNIASLSPVVEVRRLVAENAGMPDVAGELSLQMAKVCRTEGQLELARVWALDSVRSGIQGSHLEYAQLLWACNDQEQAIKILHTSGRTSGGSRVRAESLLLLALWMAETGQSRQNEVQEYFQASIETQSHWWRPYFEFAKYTDTIMDDARMRQKSSRKAEQHTAGLRFGSKARISVHQDKPWVQYAEHAINNYGLAVKYGVQATYQGLPRLLTIFFDVGSFVAELSPKGKPSKIHREALVSVLNAMNTLSQSLPTYLWLSVLPQLISRIIHEQNEVFLCNQKILIKATQKYPHQALWMLASSLMSNTESRKRRTAAIVHSARSTSNNEKPFQHFDRLHRQLMAVCNKQVDKKTRRLTFSQDFPDVAHYLAAEVIIPVRTVMNLELPPEGAPVHDDVHVPFTSMVFFNAVKDGIDLLPSLMRPKKIRVVGSDGIEYGFLAKPKDDLRKDTRMMEMAHILNRVFSIDPSCRQRSMKMRTFVVTPLTEDSGLVEWVPKTQGFRMCCQEVYVLDGRFDRRTTNQEIKKIYDKCVASGVSPAGTLGRILQNFPPRMHRWFASHFSEPATWLKTRNNFTVSSAVWSMVGHVMGLGDRHGENILVDGANGDIVMIDFSCLFDKGLTLEKPELVPFRLTQNVVDGMGITGVEGTYRRVCELTMSTLREHRDTILSIAETFVHDPLVDWSWKGSRSNAESGVFGSTQAALDALSQIQGRIAGTLIGVSSAPSLTLSVEGHVHRLIQEATDHENLGHMYIWWMPWL